MISLATLAIILSTGGILTTGALAFAFLRDPEAGMAQVTHRLENLPQIMAGRYTGFFFLAVGATLYRDLMVIAWLFAVFAFVSFFDTWVYARLNQRFAKHLAAGIASCLVVVVAAAAQAEPTNTSIAMSYIGGCA